VSAADGAKQGGAEHGTSAARIDQCAGDQETSRNYETSRYLRVLALRSSRPTASRVVT
jgi:hypothetical protein